MVNVYKSEYVAVIVLAGGTGERFGKLKQFFKVHGKQVLFHTIDLLLGFSIAKIFIVIVPPEKVSFVKKWYVFSPQVIVIAGGNSRYESTKRGLTYLANDKNHKIKYVYIHDGVRPLVTRKNFTDLYKSLQVNKSQGAILYLPVNDSLIEFQGDFRNNKYLNKEKVISLQTPHIYKLDVLQECFSRYSGKEVENAQLMESCSKKLSYVLGSRENVKLTYPHDIAFLKNVLVL